MVTLRDSNGSEVDVMMAILELIYLIMEILPWWFLPMVPITVFGAIIITVMPNWLFPTLQLGEYAGKYRASFVFTVDASLVAD
mgnify:FL=1|tara:strand:+ start:632 stop:880 length:249 start_codon:yes stop_codon:yes gene_type:complete